MVVFLPMAVRLGSHNGDVFANTLTLPSKSIIGTHILKSACPRQTGPQSSQPCFTVLAPLQRSKNRTVAPRGNAARTAVGQHGGPFEDHSLHTDHRTDHLINTLPIQTRPESTEEILLFCPLYREHSRLLYYLIREIKTWLCLDH